MQTILAKNDITVDGRHFYKGSTYTVSAEKAAELIRNNPRDIRIVERAGPIRRDKQIVEFRTTEGRQ